MLKTMRAAYREGRLAQDMKYHQKMCRKALKRSSEDAPFVTVKVSALDKTVLLRYGWSIADRSHTFAAGTGSAFMDSYIMTLPRSAALTGAQGGDKMGA